MRSWIRKGLSAAVAVPLLLVCGAGQAAQQGAPTPAAQAPAKEGNADVKIAIVDMETVIQNAKAGKSAREQLSKHRNALQTQIQKEEQALRASEQELGRQRAILSPEALNAERQKFEQRVQQLYRKVDFVKQEMSRVEGQSMVEVTKALNKVLTEIAEEGNYTLILRKDQTILSARSYDITPAVLQRLDKALPTIKVAKPASEPPPAKAPAAAAKDAPAGKAAPAAPAGKTAPTAPPASQAPSVPGFSGFGSSGK